MSPRFTATDSSHQNAGHAVFESEFGICVGASADRFHLCFGQLGVMPLLRDHIGAIIGLGAQEEMSRPHASRIVATMQNTNANGYLPVFMFPGKPVRQLIAFTYP
jgi:hypothetical protein